MKLKAYTKEWLEELCKDSYSIAEVLRKANRKITGGNREMVMNKIKQYQIDISHFKGAGWSKNLTKETDSRIKSREKYQLSDVFCENSPVTQKVLRGYVEHHKVIEYKCQLCGCAGEWLNTTIALELDHINGINTDNRIENLRYLCPNCHATTETYRGKNIKVK